MKDVYITSIMRHDSHLEFNIKLCLELEKKGLYCHFPPRDSKHHISPDNQLKYFLKDILTARKLLATNYPDSFGWEKEIEIAKENNKEIIVLSDYKSKLSPKVTISAHNILIVQNIDNLDNYINRLIKIIKK